MEKDEYVTILAVQNNEACVLDQIKHNTAYNNKCYGFGPNHPLVGHFSGMRTMWPVWTIISKELWEQKYGKIVYP